jgi:hypothetical protein
MMKLMGPVFLATCCSLAAEDAKVTVLRTPEKGIQPQTRCDDEGTAHVIYFRGDPTGGDIFYACKRAGQKDFSAPLQVNTQPHTATAIGTIRGAQMAVGKHGRVHVVWNGMGRGTNPGTSFVTDHESHQPLLYTRLNDAGTAFELERNIITYAWGLDGGSSVAADAVGDVYVAWHAAQPGNTNGEGGRAVFIARSTDEGKSFARESPAISKPTGACACCGMRAFADSQGDVAIVYRAAYEKTNRDETLLISRDKGSTFEMAYSHHWNLAACPMSSASLSECRGEIVAAAETHGRVFFVRVDPRTGKVSGPISPDAHAKYPAVAANAQGEVLLVWAEGSAWNKGGSISWQVYDREGKPVGEESHADRLPPWSLPTAFAETSGRFTIIY